MRSSGFVSSPRDFRKYHAIDDRRVPRFVWRSPISVCPHPKERPRRVVPCQTQSVDSDSCRVAVGFRNPKSDQLKIRRIQSMRPSAFVTPQTRECRSSERLTKNLSNKTHSLTETPRRAGGSSAVPGCRHSKQQSECETGKRSILRLGQ